MNKASSSLLDILSAVALTAGIGRQARRKASSLRLSRVYPNTGAVTLNVDGLGAKAVVKPDGSSLEAGDLAADQVATVIYDGTSFQLIGVRNSLDNLSDVSLASPASGDVLQNDGSGQFVDRTLAGAGIEPATAAGTSTHYFRGDKTFQTLDTSVVPENGNLYYTATRATSAASNAVSVAPGTPLSSTGGGVPTTQADSDHLAASGGRRPLSRPVPVDRPGNRLK